MPDFRFLLELGVFHKALAEQKQVVQSFWENAAQLLVNSGIQLKPMPVQWSSFRRNYFSVFFIVCFRVLGIADDRRRLFARLNHCLRAWVTCCDNLLDNELKELILTDLPQEAKIFKSVHTLMLTDRIFFRYLMEAVAGRVITAVEMRQLLEISLSAISPSGREEAQEESGVDLDLPPDKVADQIHHTKTGRLFTSPLQAPLRLGDLDLQSEAVRCVHDGLLSLGISCQILDDLNDLAMDLCNRKYNYLASLILHGDDQQEKRRLEAFVGTSRSNQTPLCDTALYKQFPNAARFARDEALRRLDNALALLCRGGVPLNRTGRRTFVNVLKSLYTNPEALLKIRDPL